MFVVLGDVKENMFSDNPQRIRSNKVRARVSRVLSFCTFLLVLCFICPEFGWSEVQNGGFEDFIEGEDFNTPADWNTVNYTAVVNNFIPQPTAGNTSNWQIDVQQGLSPFEGDYFVVLSTGDVVPEPKYAEIIQRIHVNQDETLFGVYFFGTCDYIPYNDYAEITLRPEPNDGLRPIVLVSVDVDDVNSYGSFDGWKGFEYTFDGNDAGNYDIEITVNDYQDIIYKTYLAVDGIELCVRPVQGNINNDCAVDLLDFAILSANWLGDCNDPDWCEGADLDKNGIVDVNDLYEIHENWLSGT